MKTNLFIPKTITVGFQKRSDTYTGQLAYIIYHDQKNVLRKEKSWNTWRDKKIESVLHTNEPTSGFVLNKKVGGYKSDWNFRQSYIRVYDPRGFEFEITLENLLFILAECSSFKGKGLEGDFVYSWYGTDLVLLPVSCESYRDCVKFTDRQSKKISTKDLKVGCTYNSKDGKPYTYIGHFIYTGWSWRNFSSQKKAHIFHDGTNFINFDVSKLAECINDVCVDNYAELVDKYLKSKNATYVKSIIDEKLEKPANIKFPQCGYPTVDDIPYWTKVDNTYYKFYIIKGRSYYDEKTYYVRIYNTVTFGKTGIVYKNYYRDNSILDIKDDTLQGLLSKINFISPICELSDGSKLPLSQYLKG